MESESLPTKTITKADLLRRIEAARRNLDDLIGHLSEPELIEPSNEGWSVKDHLAHLAAWQDCLLALLEGRDLWAAMGLRTDSAEPGPPDIDTINERVFALTHDRPLPDVLEHYRSSYRAVLEAVDRLSEADLGRPLVSFGAIVDSQSPIISWINDNTWRHVEEHLPWITAILDEVGPTI